METVLELVDVEKDYDIGGFSLKALDRVNFSLKRGELTSIVGPYGSGRTILLNIMGCLCQPSSGRVIVSGTDATKASREQVDRLRNQKIGFVSGVHGLIGNLTVVENLELAMHSAGAGKDRAGPRRMLDAVALSNKAQVLSSTLSILESRRLAIAKSIVAGPEILICDDPTSGLGEKDAAGIIDLLMRLPPGDRTTVVIGSPRDLLAGVEHSLIAVSGGRVLVS